MAGGEFLSDPQAAFAHRESALATREFQSLIDRYQTARLALTFVAVGMDRRSGKTYASDQLRETALPLLAESRLGAYFSLVSRPHPTREEQRLLVDLSQKPHVKDMIDELTQLDSPAVSKRQQLVFGYSYFVHTMSYWAQSGLLRNSDDPLGFFPEFTDPYDPESRPVPYVNIDRFHYTGSTTTPTLVEAMNRIEAFVKLATGKDASEDVTLLPGHMLAQICFTIGSNPAALAQRFYQQQFRNHRREDIRETTPLSKEKRSRELRRMGARARWRNMIAKQKLKQQE